MCDVVHWRQLTYRHDWCKADDRIDTQRFLNDLCLMSRSVRTIIKHVKFDPMNLFPCQKNKIWKWNLTTIRHITWKLVDFCYSYIVNIVCLLRQCIYSNYRNLSHVYIYMSKIVFLMMKNTTQWICTGWKSKLCVHKRRTCKCITILL
jgi:hypothetical protein